MRSLFAAEEPKICISGKGLMKNSTRWLNKSTACRCQRLAVGCLIEDKKSKSKKEHNSEKKKIILNCLLSSMNCAWDSEHILKVSSKYLQ